MRLPERIGIIPDGNRGWAEDQGIDKSEGCEHEISPGMSLYRMCREPRIREMSLYGFTTDNTKRPSAQRQALIRACMAAVKELAKEGAGLLVLGNTRSPVFPRELLPFTVRHNFGEGGIRINFLVNYSWKWDLGYKNETIGPGLETTEVSRIDLVIRWGGRRRLSGLLPMQFVYSDSYIVNDYWPDFGREYMEDILKWYAVQGIILGGRFFDEFQRVIVLF